MRQVERALQRLIFLSRWLAARFLLGLIAALVLLLYRFFADLLALATRVPTEGWHDLIVGILNLVDITLTANLILIVIFSGYENFLLKVDAAQHHHQAYLGGRIPPHVRRRTTDACNRRSTWAQQQ